MRWRLKLEEFEYKIVYKSGKINTNANALSRISVNANDSYVTNENIQHMLLDLVKTNLLKLPLIKIQSQDRKI